ncbi:hypothetical protein GX586_14565 [bacterium]|nr:hypothetical protein [bacterium]
MKSVFPVLLAVAVIMLPGLAQAEQKCTKTNPPYVLARGFANLATGWLEVPRGIIYENSRIPVVGFVAGPVKGAALTVWRECAGIVDVVSMGLSREGMYSSVVPDFVWDADWICPGGEDIVEPRNVDPCVCPDHARPCPCMKPCPPGPCAQPCLQMRPRMNPGAPMHPQPHGR